MENNTLNPQASALLNIRSTGITAIGHSTFGQPAKLAAVEVKHGKKQRFIGRVTLLNRQVCDQPAALTAQVDFMTVLNLTIPFDNDVRVWLEEADNFSVEGTFSP